MPTLTIQLPGLPPVEHILREEAITVGRMKGNTIALDDSSVSLSHAKITRLGNDYFLKDLNSTNGTMLNGQSINEARLRDGDQLRFGEVIARFRLEPAFAPLALTSGATEGSVPQPTAQSVPVPSAAPVPIPPPRAAAGSITPSAHRQSAPAQLPVEIQAELEPVRRGPRPNPVHLLVPVLGGLSVIGVVGFIVWKIISGNLGGSEPVPASASSPASANSAVQKLTPADSRATASTPPTLEATRREVPTTVAEVQPETQSLAELIKSLHSPDAAERRHAAEAISSLDAGAPDAVPALRDALKDGDPDVRMWSALALINNKVYDKAAIPILVQVLRHENPTLRQVACISLALIPYDAADKALVIPALSDLASKDANEEVRKDALTALKVIAPDSVADQ